MAAAVTQKGGVPRTGRFTGDLQAVHAFGTARLFAADSSQEALQAALYCTMGAHPVGQRPDRVEPRAVKRRPKPHPLLTIPRHQARQRLYRGQQHASGSAIHPRDCLLSTYTQHRKTCLRDYRDSACEVTLALLPGKEYELEVSPPVTAPPMVIAALVSGNFFSRERISLGSSSACRFVRLRTEQEDYEAVW